MNHNTTITDKRMDDKTGTLICNIKPIICKIEEDGSRLKKKLIKEKT